jgi:hypothetical protein
MAKYDVIRYIRGCDGDTEKAIRIARTLIQGKLRGYGDVNKIRMVLPINDNCTLIILEVVTELSSPNLARLLQGIAWVEYLPEQCVERLVAEQCVKAGR